MSQNPTDGIHTRLLHAGAHGCAMAPDRSTCRWCAPAPSASNVETLADRHHRRSHGERIATYGRHGLDTHEALEDALRTLEGGHRAFLAPSGLSAITLVLLALGPATMRWSPTRLRAAAPGRPDPAAAARRGDPVFFART
jgi:cystathionine beta-lyase